MSNPFFSSVRETLLTWQQAMSEGSLTMMSDCAKRSQNLKPGYWIVNVNQGFEINCFARFICFFSTSDSGTLLLCENINGNFCTYQEKNILCLLPATIAKDPEKEGLAWAIDALKKHQIVKFTEDPPTPENPHPSYDSGNDSLIYFYPCNLAATKMALLEKMTKDKAEAS